MAFATAARRADLAPSTPHRVDVDGVPVSLIACDDEVFAIHDTCSNQEYSLAEGLVWDCQIECSLHGSMFDLRTGSPSGLPATVPVPVFPVRVDGDAVLVDVADPLNDAPFPEH